MTNFVQQLSVACEVEGLQLATAWLWFRGKDSYEVDFHTDSPILFLFRSIGAVENVFHNNRRRIYRLFVFFLLII